MKKLLSFILVAALVCTLAVSALAVDSAPSRSTGDMVKVELEGEKLPKDADLFIEPLNEETTRTQEQKEARETCETELDKLAEARTVEDYFGKVTDKDDKEVKLSKLMGTADLRVYEFCPIIAGNYKDEYGDVTARMLFATPYAPGEKVLIMIGFVTENENNEKVVEWKAFEAEALALEKGQGKDKDKEFGAIKVTLDAETTRAVQDGEALVAVVSKPAEQRSQK